MKRKERERIFEVKETKGRDNKKKPLNSVSPVSENTQLICQLAVFSPGILGMLVVLLSVFGI